MRFFDISYPDINNGIGLRATLWLAGCSHHCKGCQNPQTWDGNSGKRFDKRHREKLLEIVGKSYINGLTLSGGDPLYEDTIDDLTALLSFLKEQYPEKTIWIYTGYTWEEILSDQKKKEVIKYCDVLVDGEYKQELRDVTLAFRGSKNQRLIDIQKSLKNNEVVLWEINK